MSTPAASSLDPEAARLLAAQRREFVVRRRWLLATRLTSLAFAAWYLTLLIGFGRDAPFYLLVSVFAVVTGLSGLVVVNYFDPPLLLRNLHRPDDDVRAASWRALQAIRHELLPPIVQDLGVPEGPERDALIHTADLDELVRRPAPKLRGDRRRFGRIWLIAYLVVAAGVITLVCNYETLAAP
jgi:hypothetical protein